MARSSLFVSTLAAALIVGSAGLAHAQAGSGGGGGAGGAGGTGGSAGTAGSTGAGGTGAAGTNTSPGATQTNPGQGSTTGTTNPTTTPSATNTNPAGPAARGYSGENSPTPGTRATTRGVGAGICPCSTRREDSSLSSKSSWPHRLALTSKLNSPRRSAWPRVSTASPR